MTRTGTTLVFSLVLAGLAAVGCAKSGADSSSGGQASPSANAPDVDAVSKTVAKAGGPLDASHGKTIFATNCASCHGATGAGGGVGPTLKGEKARKDQAAAVAWIKNPQPPMPKLYPSPLSDKDVADVAAYVESL